MAFHTKARTWEKCVFAGVRVDQRKLSGVSDLYFSHVLT